MPIYDADKTKMIYNCYKMNKNVNFLLLSPGPTLTAVRDADDKEPAIFFTFIL
jgi:hypothetical protein